MCGGIRGDTGVRKTLGPQMGARIYDIGLVCLGLLVFTIQQMLPEIPREKTLVVGNSFITLRGTGRMSPHGPALAGAWG